jgi:hypothetical protein
MQKVPSEQNHSKGTDRIVNFANPRITGFAK